MLLQNFSPLRDEMTIFSQALRFRGPNLFMDLDQLISCMFSKASQARPIMSSARQPKRKKLDPKPDPVKEQTLHPINALAPNGIPAIGTVIHTFQNMVTGKLVKRYKRFLADVLVGLCISIQERLNPICLDVQHLLSDCYKSHVLLSVCQVYCQIAQLHNALSKSILALLVFRILPNREIVSPQPIHVP